jgi:hypothetical protein
MIINAYVVLHSHSTFMFLTQGLHFTVFREEFANRLHHHSDNFENIDHNVLVDTCTYACDFQINDTVHKLTYSVWKDLYGFLRNMI